MKAGAIVAMGTAGERRSADLVVVGPAVGDEGAPCDDCRRSIREFADAAMKIHRFSHNGHFQGHMRWKNRCPKASGLRM